jgi:protein-L-isoaspartate O-methyltransferase
MSRGRLSAGLVAAVRAAGISDERVLEAMNATPRAGFVPARNVTAAYARRAHPDRARAGDHAAVVVGPDDRGPAAGWQ